MSGPLVDAPFLILVLLPSVVETPGWICRPGTDSLHLYMAIANVLFTCCCMDVEKVRRIDTSTRIVKCPNRSTSPWGVEGSQDATYRPPWLVDKLCVKRLQQSGAIPLTVLTIEANLPPTSQ